MIKSQSTWRTEIHNTLKALAHERQGHDARVRRHQHATPRARCRPSHAANSYTHIPYMEVASMAIVTTNMTTCWTMNIIIMNWTMTLWNRTLLGLTVITTIKITSYSKRVGERLIVPLIVSGSPYYNSLWMTIKNERRKSINWQNFCLCMKTILFLLQLRQWQCAWTFGEIRCHLSSNRRAGKWYFQPIQQLRLHYGKSFTKRRRTNILIFFFFIALWVEEGT